VLSVKPFRVQFRAPAENATNADFTPDSHEIVFISSVTHAGRQIFAYASQTAQLERWSIAGRSRISSTKVALPACETVELAPDGKVAACVDFAGTLRLVDTATGGAIFEKKKFGRRYLSPDRSLREAGDPGSARIEFSPDGRFVIVLPKGALGIPLAWDLGERRPVDLKGPFKDLDRVTFAFIAPGQLLVQRLHYGWRTVEVSKVLALPSGKTLSQTVVRGGGFSRAADPRFVLVHSFRSTGVRAVELRTGQAIENKAPLLDVFGDRYVSERADGRLALYQKPEVQSVGSAIVLGELPSTDGVVRTSGQVVRAEDGQFVVQTGDRREVTLLTSADTKWLDGAAAISPDSIAPGEFVDVESTGNDDEEFQAMTVNRRPAPPQAAALAQEAPDNPVESGCDAAVSARRTTPGGAVCRTAGLHVCSSA
jgi:hypothetical protein